MIISIYILMFIQWHISLYISVKFNCIHIKELNSIKQFVIQIQIQKD
jgi:hypothetical protein